jgi:hypothetical protein
MNERRTCRDSDTLLTQRRSPSGPVSDLYAKRAEVGAESEQGGLLSNVAEQLLERPNYEQPSWVSHPSQTLPYKIKQQLDRLATFQ